MTSHAATCCPPPITLWTPPHLRIAAAVSDAFWRLHDGLRAAVQRRRERAEAELLDEIDDRLRRDLGLGERAAPALIDCSSNQR